MIGWDGAGDRGQPRPRRWTLREMVYVSTQQIVADSTFRDLLLIPRNVHKPAQAFNIRSSLARSLATFPAVSGLADQSCRNRGPFL